MDITKAIEQATMQKIAAQNVTVPSVEDSAEYYQLLRHAVKIARMKLAYEHTADPEVLQNHLRPGDILLTTPAGSAKYNITTLAHKASLKLKGLPQYTHVAMYLGNNRIGHVEAGVDSKEMKYRNEDLSTLHDRNLSVAVYRPKVPTPFKRRAIQSLKQTKDIGYSKLRALAAFALPQALRGVAPVDRNAAICTDVVADAYPSLFPSSAEKPLLPAELAAHKNLGLVATFDPNNKDRPENSPITIGKNHYARPA
jgi:hypothetical protein